MIYRVDLHGLTVIESKIELDHILNSISYKYDELLVVHGYHSHILMDYIRNEYTHNRIKKLTYSLNPGDTTFMLKNRQEMLGKGEKEPANNRKYFMKGQLTGFSRWQSSDINLAKNVWLNPDCCRYLNNGAVFSNQEITEKLYYELTSEEKHHVQYWPLFDLHKNYYLGYGGVHLTDSENLQYQLEICLLPKYRRMGYGTDATNRIIEEVFGYIGGRSIFARVHPDNEAAIALLEKLGFQSDSDEFDEHALKFFPIYRLKK